MPAESPLPCFFVSDLHGHEERYQRLFEAIHAERPKAVFIGGDLLPSGIRAFSRSLAGAPGDFIRDVLMAGFEAIRSALRRDYPRIFLILGNDDGRWPEEALQHGEKQGLWSYVHDRTVPFEEFSVTGYAYVPPTPFRLKDWERYDVSRYVDPGCVSPEEGMRTVEVEAHRVRYATIKNDLDRLAEAVDPDHALFLFHSPPYQSHLDRAALDGRFIDHVPLDVHVGSIAVQRFIQSFQPLLTLHGHVHESARLTGHWRESLGRTQALSAAHDGPELALVRFDPRRPHQATRQLISTS